MTDIFLSYASKDRSFVEFIKNELETKGRYSTWMDTYEIRGGDDWEEQIKINVQRCTVFVVVVSDASNVSPWVKRECLLAEQVKKPRIPILLTHDNGNKELPFRLMDLQYIDFCDSYIHHQQQEKNVSSSQSFEEDMRTLLQVLNRYVPRTAPSNNKPQGLSDLFSLEAQQQQENHHNAASTDDVADCSNSRIGDGMSAASVADVSTTAQHHVSFADEDCDSKSCAAASVATSTCTPGLESTTDSSETSTTGSAHSDFYYEYLQNSSRQNSGNPLPQVGQGSRTNSTLSPNNRYSSNNNFAARGVTQSPLNPPPRASQSIIQQDLITVFQAAPLAWISAEDGKPQPMTSIDFEFERDLLTKTFDESFSEGKNRKILVDFEIATIDRLSYFLAKDEGRILHFSCHGDPSYLALEDDWGGLTTLQTSQLESWISAGGQNLQFVFVSACHSSLIGDAFVKAGVPHVVCCQYDSQLREDAAVEFSKTFYRYLSFGNSLQFAFNMACQEILVSPNIPQEHRAAEVQKFCLLPADQDHNVEIFYQRQVPQHRRKRFIPPVLYPPPPQICIGREVDQYKLLQAIRRSRLVRVSGVRGIGKLALVQSCCRYMNERLHMVGFNEILWIPCPNRPQCSTDDSPFGLFEDILESIHDESDREPVHYFLSKARECIHKIVEYFRFRRTLLVIDAKQFILNSDIHRLCLFIQEILRGTNYLQVVVVHHIGFDITTNRMPCSEDSIFLEPLDFDSTLALFARLCPHNQQNSSMVSVLESRQQQDLQLQQACRMSKRRLNIFHMVGGGIPSDVHRVAKTMSPMEYRRLLSLIQQPDKTLCRSRSELERKQKEVSNEINIAAQQRDFRKAGELQTFYDELEAQKSDFPDIAELRRQFDEKTFQIELSVSDKDWSKAELIQKELDKLEVSIRVETEAESAFMNSSEADVWATRAALEAQLIQLDEDYKSACAANDFSRARHVDDEIDQLREARRLKPSLADFTLKVNRLKGQLEDAKANHNLNTAEMIFKRLVEVKAKLKLEEEAESALGITVGSTTMDANGEAGAEIRSSGALPSWGSGYGCDNRNGNTRFFGGERDSKTGDRNNGDDDDDGSFGNDKDGGKVGSGKEKASESLSSEKSKSSSSKRPALDSQPSATSLQSHDPPDENTALSICRSRRFDHPVSKAGGLGRRRQNRSDTELDKSSSHVGHQSALSVTTDERGVASSEESGTKQPDAVFNEPIFDAVTEFESRVEEEQPGAIRINGSSAASLCDGTDPTNDDPATLEELQESSVCAAASVSASLEENEEDQYVVTAQLVKEQHDLEEVIMDTLRRNTVQAESVSIEDSNNNREGSGDTARTSLRRFFKRWGKKKK